MSIEVLDVNEVIDGRHRRRITNLQNIEKAMFAAFERGTADVMNCEWIAGRAGVSKRTLHHLIDSFDDLKSDVCMKWLMTIDARVIDAHTAEGSEDSLYYLLTELAYPTHIGYVRYLHECSQHDAEQPDAYKEYERLFERYAMVRSDRYFTLQSDLQRTVLQMHATGLLKALSAPDRANIAGIYRYLLQVL